MSQPRLWVLLLLLLLCSSACLDTGQERMVVPLSVSGTETPIVMSAGDVAVTLDRADVAFGPLHLCAGVQAGDSCETARFEWLDAVVVDALTAESRSAGELTGVSGTVLSFMYDLGISSQLVRDDPFVLDAAESLGGYSVVIEGSAELGGTPYPFVARLAIQQTTQTELGVPVVRSSLVDAFERDVSPGETGLTIVFDPAVWVRDVDFSVYAEDAACAPGVSVVCAGALEQRCDETGALLESRACTGDTVCVAGLGCQEHIDIEPDSQAYREIRSAMLIGERPAFRWEDPPE